MSNKYIDESVFVPVDMRRKVALWRLFSLPEDQLCEIIEDSLNSGVSQIYLMLEFMRIDSKKRFDFVARNE